MVSVIAQEFSKIPKQIEYRGSNCISNNALINNMFLHAADHIKHNAGMLHISIEQLHQLFAIFIDHFEGTVELDDTCKQNLK